MSLRLFSMTRSVEHIPIALNSLPSTLATEVLPVPGFPVRMMFTGRIDALPPNSIRRCWKRISSARSLRAFLTDSIPTKESSSFITLSTEISFVPSGPAMSSQVRTLPELAYSSSLRPAVLVQSRSKQRSNALRTSRALPKVSVRLRYIRSKYFPTLPAASSERDNPFFFTIFRNISVSSLPL